MDIKTAIIKHIIYYQFSSIYTSMTLNFSDDWLISMIQQNL